MREIKFRGKNIDTEQWVYGDLLHKDGKTYIGYWVKDDDSPSGDGYIECEVLPATVGQYVGTKDDKKQEIYEDDIVIVVNISDTFTGIVVYDLEEQDFKATNGKTNYENNFSYICGCEELEKLGNKFDDPELIK